MKYSSFIQINEDFQTSVNLELDLNNKNKIKNYVPTTDICDVLKRYMKAILNQSHDKATTLVGPYGKGKSFLLLVLSYIVSKEKKDATYNELLKKIKKVDSELYSLIQEFDSNNYRLLPVIINSTYDNLNQSFLLALNEALERNKLDKIVPKTVYSVCLEVLDNWKKDATFNQKVVDECVKKHKGLTLKKLRIGLEDYSSEAYSQFESIYNCVTKGVSFNPLVNNDLVKIYSDVNYEICKHGYTGMFIIFDEFSKFLDGAGESLSKDLKLIQDLAELANRSGATEQIDLCCVTHKTLDLYSKNSQADLFKTVEGRFKEIKFNRSLSENYQLISYAINKKDNKSFDTFYKKNADFYKLVSQTELFKNESNFKDLIKGCYPLNPITVYALIHLSEIVAQNERTLFTFISDTDDNSFNSFIQKNSEGLFNTDKIYDYFSELLKKEETNNIRNIWYRADAIRSKLGAEDQKIIKAIAVILMINELEEFPCNVDMIALSLNIDVNKIDSKVNELIEKHYLRRNIINQMISFDSVNSKEINKQLSLVSKTKLKSIDFGTLLTDISETKYFLPRRYNENYKITRFYRNVYITEEQFSKLSSLELIKEECFSDGLIVNVIRKTLSEKSIKQIADKINDDTAIIRYPKNKINGTFDDLIVKYASLVEIENRGGNDDVVTAEIKSYKDETLEDIRLLLNTYFDEETNIYSSLIKKFNNFNDLMSLIFERVYSSTIIFNNELVNKNKVSTQYQKSIDHANDWILNNSEERGWPYGATSPETTVMNSIIKQISEKGEARILLDDIKSKIIKSEKKKILMSDLMDKAINPPYSIRKGLLPCFICVAINELSDNVILYLNNTEIELNSANITKSINSSNDYFIGFSKGSGEQESFVKETLDKLQESNTNNFRYDVRNLSNALKKYFNNLPLILRNDVIEYPNKLQGITEYKSCFNGYNTNPSEVVLDKPIESFGSYKSAKKVLYDFADNWEKLVDEFKNNQVKSVKKIFDISNNTSLKMGVNSYLKGILGDLKPMMSDADTRIYNTLCDLSFNDLDAINEISGVLVGTYIEDWNIDHSDELVNGTIEFVKALNNSNTFNEDNLSLNELLEESKNIKQTDMGQFLKNDIQSALEEYSGSVSKEEKLAILSQFIKNLL